MDPLASESLLASTHFWVHLETLGVESAALPANSGSGLPFKVLPPSPWPTARPAEGQLWEEHAQVRECAPQNLTPSLCPDVNECDQQNGGCSQVCHNKPGSFHCTCHSGFALAPDGRTCQGKAHQAPLSPPVPLSSSSLQSLGEDEHPLEAAQPSNELQGAAQHHRTGVAAPASGATHADPAGLLLACGACRKPVRPSGPRPAGRRASPVHHQFLSDPQLLASSTLPSILPVPTSGESRASRSPEDTPEGHFRDAHPCSWC